MAMPWTNVVGAEPAERPRPAEGLILLAQAEAEAPEAERPGRRLLRERLEREGRLPGQMRDRENAPRRPAERARDLTLEQEAQVIAVLKDINPELAQRVTEALEHDRADARRMLARVWNRTRDLIELRAHNPDLYRLKAADSRHRFEVFRLVQQIRRARRAEDTEAVKRLLGELRTTLQSHFQVRQELREYELAQLEQRIQKLRAELADHRRNKDELIEQALTRIEEGQPPQADDEAAEDRPHHPPHAAPPRRPADAARED